MKGAEFSWKNGAEFLQKMDEMVVEFLKKMDEGAGIFLEKGMKRRKFSLKNG